MEPKFQMRFICEKKKSYYVVLSRFFGVDVIRVEQ